MIKKILLIFASLFLVVQSYKLLTIVVDLEYISWYMLIVIAWLLNMFITGIFAFSGFALPTQKLMPQSYYHIHRPSMLTRVYSLLKVDVFRKFLLATLWRNQGQRKRYFNGKKQGMASLVEHSKKSEFGHLLPFIILNFVVLYFAAKGIILLGIATLLFNILGNFYPIMLQRHHRMRIQQILAR